MLTPPSKGTPLDLEFIGLLTKQVNDVENALRGATTSNSSINGTSVETFGKVVFFTSVLSITPGTVDANSTPTPFTFDLSKVQFKLAPVVTISVRNAGGTTGGRYVTATLERVTKESCSGVLTFAKTDNPTIEVSIIAVGISE